ncbi:hypothetical protein HCJ94_12710 [Micromonospora sp. HSS6-12]|uniref:Flavin reductase n=1 Tax=Micromonospora thermarum TaxID=2720024 RepID=A0ABX0Z9Q7_9ACTN|nr:hypothetical protein [Micromonospora thermarum]
MTGAAESPLSTAGEHAPSPPEWTCGTCGADWPCEPKRDLLLREYRLDRGMLAVYLGSCLAAATQDLPPPAGTSLQDRFMGWLPRQPRPI